MSSNSIITVRCIRVSACQRDPYTDQFELDADTKATVREALEFSALLRQDARLSRSEKLAYVDVVLDVLDLSPLADAIIGTVSAGLNSEQRKRLTIAVEVVARPKILFCDEPTTNLDTKAALKVIRLLKRLSRTGIAVIATVHQPVSKIGPLASALADQSIPRSRPRRSIHSTSFSCWNGADDKSTSDLVSLPSPISGRWSTTLPLIQPIYC